MEKLEVSGDLPTIIANGQHLYEGDLAHYFRVLFFEAANLTNPYHNFRHMLHVLWLCYQACEFYKKELSPRRMRSLLIAALFHDFDHPGPALAGVKDPDATAVPIAIASLRGHILLEDRDLLPEIEATIEATYYPYTTSGQDIDLLGQIIRDADLAQALAAAWIQQVVIGLAQEWNVKPLDVLKLQPKFLGKLPFNTEWARRLFPQEVVRAKVEEAERLLQLLLPEPEDHSAAA